MCPFRKEEGIFRSESLATLSVLKEVITKEATARDNKFNINLGKGLLLQEWQVGGYEREKGRGDAVTTTLQDSIIIVVLVVKEDSTDKVLEMLYPILKVQVDLAKKVQLIEALKVSSHVLISMRPFFLNTRYTMKLLYHVH